jgi:hypothetical protein
VRVMCNGAQSGRWYERNPTERLPQRIGEQRLDSIREASALSIILARRQRLGPGIAGTA